VERAERFARASALANEVPPPHAPLGLVVQLAIPLVSLIYGILWVLRHLHLPEVLLAMAGWLVMWLGLTAVASRNAWQPLKGSFVRKPVMIVHRQIGEGAMRYIVVEDERGVRWTQLVSKRVFEAATVGTIGVLFTKKNRAWGFHPVA
jgi:hypothetical protein